MTRSAKTRTAKAKKDSATKVPKTSRKLLKAVKLLPKNAETLVTKESITCDLCADIFRCHSTRARSKCTKCKSLYHRSCVSFLPMQETETHMSVVCPSCLFESEDSKKHRAPSAKRYKGHSQESFDAAKAFLNDGYYMFPSSVIFPGKTKQLKSLIDELFKEHWKAFKSQKKVRSIKKGFSNFRQRSPGRFEIVYPGLYEFMSRLSLSTSDSTKKKSNTPIWMPILKHLLGEKLRLSASGVFLALPDAKTQPFHTDGPALSSKYNLPCHAINLFIPLVKTGPFNGTQIEPGTQISPHKDSKRFTGELEIPSHTKRTERYVVPEVAAGGAYLFDYRVRHRGLANLTKSNRPCVYFTFTRDWYSDTENFSNKRYSKELPVSLRFPKSL